MSEKNRYSNTTTRRTPAARTSASRPSSARTNASRTARGSYNGAARPVQRKGRRRKTLFGIDIETLLALALIVVILAGIITLSVIGIKKLIKNNTTVVNYEVSANITPEETPVPENYYTTPEPTQAVSNQDGYVVTAPTSTPYVPSVSGLRSARIRTVGDFVMSKNMLSSHAICHQVCSERLNQS